MDFPSTHPVYSQAKSGYFKMSSVLQSGYSFHTKLWGIYKHFWSGGRVRWGRRLSRTSKLAAMVWQPLLSAQSWMLGLLTYTTTSCLATVLLPLSLVLVTELRVSHILGKCSPLSYIPSHCFAFALREGTAAVSPASSLKPSCLGLTSVGITSVQATLNSESLSVSVFPTQADSQTKRNLQVAKHLSSTEILEYIPHFRHTYKINRKKWSERKENWTEK